MPRFILNSSRALNHPAGSLLYTRARIAGFTKTRRPPPSFSRRPKTNTRGVLYADTSECKTTRGLRRHHGKIPRGIHCGHRRDLSSSSSSSKHPGHINMRSKALYGRHSQRRRRFLCFTFRHVTLFLAETDVFYVRQCRRFLHKHCTVIINLNPRAPCLGSPVFLFFSIASLFYKF